MHNKTMHRNCGRCRNLQLKVAGPHPVITDVSSGRFPCRADLRCGLRIYRRDVGEATLPQQLPESHIEKLSQPVRFLSVLSKLLDSH